MEQENLGSILFLDVDGVLNRVGTKERSCHGTYGIEPSKAAMVLEIVEKTFCSVVVSSSWRKYDDLYAEIIRSIPNVVIGRTPVDRSGAYKCRGEEILQWIKSNSDISPFEEVFVHTDAREGLTHELKNRAISLMNEQEPRLYV